MFNKKLFFVVFCAVGFAPSALQAQQGPSDPTMEQTVAFLSEMLEKQGPLPTKSLQHPDGYTVWSGSLKLEGRCSLVVTSRLRFSSGMFHGDIVSVDLSRSEPTSVTISPQSDLTPQAFSLEIRKAYREVRSISLPADSSPSSPIASDDEVTGTVQTNTAGTLLIVTDRGQLRSLTASRKSKVFIYKDGKTIPAAISDAAADDTIIVVPKSKSITIIKSALQQLNGYGEVSVAMVGDQDTANRMAKALIHALVLCHKDDKPSLF